MPIIDDIRLPNGVEVIDSTILEFKATTTSRYPDTLVGGYYYIPGTFYWTTYTPDEIKNGDCNHVADYFKYTGFGAIKLTVDSLFVGGTVKGDMDYYCGNTLFETTKFYFLIRGVRIFEPNGDINYGGTAKTKPFTLTISPNPVYNNATIKYNLASASNVNISIYDMMNNPVKMLINTKQQAGNYSLQWDGRYSNGNTAATGIYTALALIDGKKYIYKIQVLK